MRTVGKVLLVLVLLAVAWTVLLRFFLLPHEVRNPKKYSSLLTEWRSRGLVKHFPDPLPSSATNIKLSSFPGVMQAGAWLQVRFNLPPDEVGRIFDEASRVAKDYYDGGDIYESVNSEKHGLAGTSFHTYDPDDGKSSIFPEDYRVFVFAASDDGGSWNHGQSSGVVVSKQRNEVIYFAEDW